MIHRLPPRQGAHDHILRQIAQGKESKGGQECHLVELLTMAEVLVVTVGPCGSGTTTTNDPLVRFFYRFIMSS